MKVLEEKYAKLEKKQVKKNDKNTDRKFKLSIFYILKDIGQLCVTFQSRYLFSRGGSSMLYRNNEI